MSNLVPMQRGSVAGPNLWDANKLSLIRRTVAKDANDDEFSVFIEMARALKLDPLRKQIYCFIHNKHKPDKRQLTLVTSINGFRTIAERTGNYRPDEDAPEFEYDPALKGPSNPLGLVKATVRVWKHTHGAWHKITGESYWDEAAPLKDEWKEDETGERRPTGKKVLDQSGNWPKMARVMLAKTSEAGALRRGWPDELSNVYADEEIDRSKFIDLTPAEAVAANEVERRLERIGGKDSLIVDWMTGDLTPMEVVPVGKFADKVIEFISANKDEPSRIEAWRIRNKATLQMFWTSSPTDALELKRRLESALGVAA